MASKKLTFVRLQTSTLTAFGEGIKILCIKDHVRSSINDSRERMRAITNTSFVVGASTEEEDDEQLSVLQFSENYCSCVFYLRIIALLEQAVCLKRLIISTLGSS